jgi:peptidoglycan/LPS O-acetylase OafA/YrhL
MGILRTTLAVSVVLFHLGGIALLVPGDLAVELFYCISGFLITFVLTQTTAYSGLKSFYINRFLRIYPVYWTVAIVVLALHLIVPSDFHHYSAFHHYALPTSAKVVLFFSNLLIFGQDCVMFLAVRGGHLHWTANFKDTDAYLFEGLLIGPAWTLGLELTFYLIAPFIARSTRVLAIICALSLGVKAYLYYLGIGDVDPWSYRFFPAELSLFCLGGLSARILLPLWKEWLRGKEALSCIGVAVVLGYVAMFYVLPSGAARALVLLAVTIPLLPTLFIFSTWFKPFDESIGDLSYPIYISHLLVIGAVSRVLTKLRIMSPHLILIAQLLMVLVAAYLLKVLVADRVEVLRRKVKRSGAANALQPQCANRGSHS